jgi:hypothetical protein
MKMKRNVLKRLAVGACMATLCLFVGCAAAQDPLNGLSEEQIETIRSAAYTTYIKADPDTPQEESGSVAVRQYLGTYGGVMALKMQIAITGEYYQTVVDSLQIDGVTIGEYSGGYGFYAYISAQDETEGKVVRLEDAYEDGYLTKGNLRKIASKTKKFGY